MNVTVVENKVNASITYQSVYSDVENNNSGTLTVDGNIITIGVSKPSIVILTTEDGTFYLSTEDGSYGLIAE